MRETWALPRVADRLVGVLGVVAGVAVATLEDAPVPAELTAETLNVYSWPFVRPVTVTEVDVLTPSLKVVHEEPPSVLYCTT